MTKDDFQIIKRRINLDNLEEYDFKKIKKSEKILKETISNTLVNDFAFLIKLNKISSNKGITLEEAYNSYKGEIPTIDCIGLSKILKEKLNKIGINTYFITCKAKGFSTKYGDSLIKEAHTFLIYPCQKKKKTLFIIYDSGFRIKKPLIFYDKDSSKEYKYLTGKVKINYENNSYSIKANVRMKRDFSIIKDNVNWYFNPYEETTNIDYFTKNIYKVKFSYKIMYYNNIPIKRFCLGLNIVTQKLDLYSYNYHEEYYLDEFLKLSKEELFQKLSFLKTDNKFTEKDIEDLLQVLKIYAYEDKIPILNYKIVQEFK